MIPLIQQIDTSRAADFAAKKYAEKARSNLKYAVLAKCTCQQISLLPPEQLQKIQKMIKKVVQQSFAKTSMLMIFIRNYTQNFLNTALIIPSQGNIIKIQAKKLPYTPFQCSVAVGAKIYGIYIDANSNHTDKLTEINSISPAAVAKECQTPVAILFGSNKNTQNMLALTKFYLERKISVAFFTYRTTTASIENALELNYYDDAQASIHYIKQIKKVTDDQIILHGTAFAGAVAAEMAQRHPHAHLILDQTFPTFPDVIREYIKNNYNGKPWIHSEIIAQIVDKHLQFRTIEKTCSVASKVLVIYVEDDKMMPPFFAMKPAAHCMNENAQIISTPADGDKFPWYTIEEKAREFENYLLDTGLCHHKE